MISRAALAIAFVSAVWMRGQMLSAQMRTAEAMTELADTKRDLMQANAILAQAAEVTAVHRAHIKRLTAEAEVWAETTRDLQSLEGRDAPLSDHMRRAASRLWP